MLPNSFFRLEALEQHRGIDRLVLRHQPGHVLDVGEELVGDGGADRGEQPALEALQVEGVGKLGHEERRDLPDDLALQVRLEVGAEILEGVVEGQPQRLSDLGAVQRAEMQPLVQELAEVLREGAGDGAGGDPPRHRVAAQRRPDGGP